MKYVALKNLVYSEGGPGHYDSNGNWQGDSVRIGQDVSVTHLNTSQINLLVNMGAIAPMPEIEIKKPGKAPATVKAEEDTKDMEG